MIFLCGCGEKTLSYSNIYRDDYKTGGNLNFFYDDQTHIAYFGEEGEVISYYKEDIAKGWNEEGNLIGIKIYPPCKLDNYLSGTAKVGDREYENGSFYVLKDDQVQMAEFFIKVEDNKKEYDLKIKWQDNIKEQNYRIIVKQGTLLEKNT